MEEIKFTESEQRYFGELFLGYDSENTGKIPTYKASELFRSANLPVDVLKQITDLCGGNRATYISRHQFYLALKLIAVVQAGLPVRIDLLHSSLDVPLPHFYRTNSLERPGVKRSLQASDSPDLIQLSDTDSTPLRGSVDPETSSDGEVEVQTDSPCPNGASPRKGNFSPGASSTASDSPTPTNSVRLGSQWQGLLYEEHRQLLGTEEESSDRHSSDEEGTAGTDVWNISDEQREYYSAQFRSLQPDPQGLVAGPVARTFFEKSKLPVQELRKIWQLADVSKDGALSLQEFNTAMHLVVLRRNNINLPDSLPQSLLPRNHPTSSVQSLSPPPEEHSSPPKNKEWTKFVDSPTSSISSPGPKPVNFDFHKSAVEQDPKILHPVPLRLTPESQGIPPVEDEPCRSPRKISEPRPIPYEQFGNDTISPKKTIAENNSTSSDIRPIQRPQPKKPAAPGPGAIPPPPHPVTAQPIEENATLPPAGVQSGPVSLPMSHLGPKKEPPPPPPPRPYRTHTRSSSLDLNRMTKTGGGLLGAPPVIPPRVSPNATSPKKLIGQHSEGDVLALAGERMDFADFAHFGQVEESTTDTAHPRKHGAFEVYRKPVARRKGSDNDKRGHSQEMESPVENSTLHYNPGNSSSKKLQEQNMVLTRICQHLSRELAQVQEEKLALELHLEQLRIQGERSGITYQNG